MTCHLSFGGMFGRARVEATCTSEARRKCHDRQGGLRGGVISHRPFGRVCRIEALQSYTLELRVLFRALEARRDVGLTHRKLLEA